MSAPAVSQTALDLYDELGVTQPRDEQLGWPFLIWLAGLATGLGRLPLIVRDTDDAPGWSVIFDVAQCPDWALAWLAQFVGVRVPAGEDPELTRARIQAHAGFNRGTPAAIRAAGQIYLTGTRHITLVEQADGNPWLAQIITLASETPDPAALLASVLRQKPAGIKLTHDVVEAQAWNEATTTWDTAPTVAWDDVSASNPV